VTRRSTRSSDWAKLRSNLTDLIARFGLNDIDVNAAPTVMLVGTGTCRDRFPIGGGRMTVGRSPMAAISLDQECVSRAHATLEKDDGALTIRVRDNGSSNGTFVNGLKVSEAELHDGDVVHFGPDARFLIAVVPARPIPEPVAETESVPQTELEGGPRPTVMPPPRETPPARRAPPSPPAEPDPTRPISTGAPVTEPSVRALAPSPPESETKDALERERQQLALLFQISLRYLEAPPDEHPADVLFSFLDRVCHFDAAFLATRAERSWKIRVHPSGVSLGATEYEELVGAADAEAAVAFEDAEHEVVASSLTVRSHAILPTGSSAYLVLASSDATAYGGELEFLSLLAQVHRAAIRRFTSVG